MTAAVREVHVYCGNATKYRGFFEDAEECAYEGDVILPESPEDDPYELWVCPDCGTMNTVRDHS